MLLADLGHLGEHVPHLVLLDAGGMKKLRSDLLAENDTEAEECVLLGQAQGREGGERVQPGLDDEVVEIALRGIIPADHLDVHAFARTSPPDR